MKLSKSFQGLLIGSALLLATDAFAANKGTLHVSSPEIVAGERLAPGDYTVRWDGTGPSVQFRIMQGGKVVVAAPARVVALDTPPLAIAWLYKRMTRGPGECPRCSSRDRSLHSRSKKVPAPRLFKAATEKKPTPP
jgi:hypothetical protein